MSKDTVLTYKYQVKWVEIGRICMILIFLSTLIGGSFLIHDAVQKTITFCGYGGEIGIFAVTILLATLTLQSIFIHSYCMIVFAFSTAALFTSDIIIFPQLMPSGCSNDPYIRTWITTWIVLHSVIAGILAIVICVVFVNNAAKPILKYFKSLVTITPVEYEV